MFMKIIQDMKKYSITKLNRRVELHEYFFYTGHGNANLLSKSVEISFSYSHSSTSYAYLKFFL